MFNPKSIRDVSSLKSTEVAVIPDSSISASALIKKARNGPAFKVNYSKTEYPRFIGNSIYDIDAFIVTHSTSTFAPYIEYNNPDFNVRTSESSILVDTPTCIPIFKSSA